MPDSGVDYRLALRLVPRSVGTSGNPSRANESSSRLSAYRMERVDLLRVGQSGPAGRWQVGHHSAAYRPGMRAMV